MSSNWKIFRHMWPCQVQHQCLSTEILITKISLLSRCQVKRNFIQVLKYNMVILVLPEWSPLLVSATGWEAFSLIPSESSLIRSPSCFTNRKYFVTTASLVSTTERCNNMLPASAQTLIHTTATALTRFDLQAHEVNESGAFSQW